jgi:hypothetical protein
MQAEEHGLVSRNSVWLLYIRQADGSRNTCTDTKPLTVKRHLSHMYDPRQDPQVTRVFDFHRMTDEFKNSESHQLFLLVHNNIWVKSAVVKNFHELTRWTKKHNDPQSDEIMWKHDDSLKRNRIQQNVIRHISNYLSSLFAFIDFHRAHNDKYLQLNEEMHKQSENLKNAKHSSHKFLQELRNYFIHYKPIPFGSEVTYKIDWDIPRRRFYVSKTRLLEWIGWTNEAKSFLLNQEEKIPLFDLLNAHFRLFMNSQFEQFKLLLLTNPALTDDLMNRLNAVYSQAKLIGATGSLPFNAVFLRYLSLAQKKAKTTLNNGV